MRIIFLILAIFFALFWVKPAFAAPTPNIISSPNTVAIETPFEIQINIQGDPSTSYNLKARIGTAGSLTKGQTHNPQNSPPDDWLSDTSAWSKFPTATTDSSGFWQGLLTVRVSSTATIGDNLLFFRIRKVSGSTTTYDSDSQNIVLISSPASPTPSPTPTPTSTPSSASSSFIISNVPSQIDSTEVFNVSVNLSVPNSPNTIFYLKGAFKKADSSNYFGLTKVSGSWIKNNKTFSDQYKITTDSSGSWTGSLEIQPDILDSGYEGSGEYIFKVGRYTESGSLTWSDEASIKINAQEVLLEEAKDADILGAKSDTGKKSKISTSKAEELSLEKYIKVASPASKPASATPSAEVKGERRINFLSILGTILVIIGAIPIGYAIYNKFRKRNKGVS